MQRSQLLEEAFEVQVSMMQIWKQCFAELLREEGVTFSQMAVLMHIGERQPVMGKDIAQHMQQTPSAVTQLIDGLPRAGLVLREQDASDRRIVRLRLSKEGQRLVDRFKDKRKELFFKSAETFTDEELQTELAFQQKALQQLRAYVATQA